MEIRRLNFANLEDCNYFLDSHGGEDFLKEQYPLVYQAYLRTKEEAIRKDAEQSLIIDAGMRIPTIKNENKEEKEEQLELKQSFYVNVNDKTANVSMTGEIKNGISNRTYSVFYENFSGKDISENNYRCETEARNRIYINPTERDCVYSECQIDAIGKNKQLDSIIISEINENMATIKDAVESFVIDKPKARLGYKEIIIVYKDREWKEGVAYSYPDVKVENEKVETMLPISGKITFKNGFIPKNLANAKSDGIKLIYANDITLNYQYAEEEIKKYFQIKDNVVTFEFNDDWNATLASEKYGHELLASLSCKFFFDVWNENEESKLRLPFFISTASEEEIKGKKYYEVKNDSNVYIPWIRYIWGCFAKDTMILMGDGKSYKKISEIKEGEYIWVQGEEAVSVKAVITGTEKELIVIETESGNVLKVTEGHPILTERGSILAEKLNITDKVALRDGSYSNIKFLYPERYEDKIYSLQLEEAHMICANGILAGDFTCQNRGLELKKKNLEMSQDVQELVEEMKRLGEYLKISRKENMVTIKNIVESFVVEKPRAKEGYKEIIIAYKDKEWKEGVAYSYPDVKTENGRVETMLPISGKIIFKEGFIPKRLRKAESKLLYENDIILHYQHPIREIENYFNIEGNIVTFEFNDDWNATLPLEKYGHELSASLSCGFFLEIEDEKEHRMLQLPFLISSANEEDVDKYYVAKGDNNVYIPCIRYIYGDDESR